MSPTRFREHNFLLFTVYAVFLQHSATTEASVVKNIKKKIIKCLSDSQLQVATTPKYHVERAHKCSVL